MTSSKTPWKPKNELEGNPINLPREAAEQIVPELDAHLAAFGVLFHQYQKHHWLVEGPQFRDLHMFLEESYTKVQKHFDAIAERITALGGVPTSSPIKQSKLSYIEHEPEGAFRAVEMLARDRQAEGTVAAKLRSTIRLCTEHRTSAARRCSRRSCSRSRTGLTSSTTSSATTRSGWALTLRAPRSRRSDSPINNRRGDRKIATAALTSGLRQSA